MIISTNRANRLDIENKDRKTYISDKSCPFVVKVAAEESETILRYGTCVLNRERCAIVSVR